MSDRDKKLIIVLLAVAILGGAWWFSGKISAENEALDKEHKDLKIRYESLVAMNAKRATYQADTQTNTSKYNEIMASFNASLSQEQTIMFLNAVEKNTGVWLKQMSLETTSQIYAFGNVRSTNPSTRGQKVYNSDYIGITTKSNVSYQCSYEQLKAVLTYISQNGRKVTIDSMSYSYAAATDIVSGTMALSFYAITGQDRPPMNIDINDVFVGTDNIFASDTFVGSGSPDNYKDMIVNSYDMYVIVNRTGADKNAVICGQSGDLNNQTVVSANGGGIENVSIVVTGTAGNYKVSYKVGSMQYPAENYEAGAPLICGDALDLLIVSSLRDAEGDTSEINLFIQNLSDISVNAAIINDDPQNPRVKINNVEGAVTFYQ